MSRPRNSAKAVAAQIHKSYQRTKKLLEDSMIGLPTTCKAYLDRVLALAKLDQSFRDELAARGIVPLHVGNAVRTVYQFVATVDEQPLSVDAQRAAWEQELDEEFMDTPSPTPPAAEEPPVEVPARKSKKKGK